MNLVKFLSIAAILSLVFGELGKFPFGLSSQAVGITDVFVALNSILFLIWKIGIEKELYIPRLAHVLACFWVVGFLSLIMSGDLSGILYLVRFVFYSFNFLIFYTLIREKLLGLADFYVLVSILTICLVMLGFLQLIFFPNLGFLTDYGYDPHIGRLTSVFLDPNFAGGILNLGLLVLISFYQKISPKKFYPLIFLIIISIILTFSRSAYLQLFIQIFLFSLFINRKLLLVLFLIPLILYFSVPRFAQRINGGFSFDVTATERVASWEKGLVIFSGRPVLGVGFNNLRNISVDQNLIKTFSPDGGHSGAGIDSGFLVVLATTGIIGFITYSLFFILVISRFWTFWRRSRDVEIILCLSGITGILIHSQFVNSLFYPPVMLIFYSYLGSIYAKTEHIS